MAQVSNPTLSTFPNLDEAKALIKKFKDIQWPLKQKDDSVKSYVNSFINRIQQTYGNWLDVILPLTAADFQLPVYRARYVDQIDQVGAIGQHSYTPVSLTHSPGRCHFKGYPVFYGALDPLTSLVEVYNKMDHSSGKFCISKWKVHSTKSRLMLQYFTQMDLQHGSALYDFSQDFESHFKSSINDELTESQIGGVKLLLQYLHSLFVSEESYSITAALAHRGLYADHNFRTDILLYPSVASKLNGGNVAIQPNFVDNHMYLDLLYMVEMIDYDPELGKVNLFILNIGYWDKNVLFWKPFNPENNDQMDLIRKDFGQNKISVENPKY